MLRVRAEVVTAADRKDSAIDFAVEGDDVLNRDLMDLSLGSEEKVLPLLCSCIILSSGRMN